MAKFNVKQKFITNSPLPGTRKGAKGSCRKKGKRK